jgi:hypothetical protein
MLAAREKVHCCTHSVGCWLKEHCSNETLIVQAIRGFKHLFTMNYTIQLLVCCLCKLLNCWGTHPHSQLRPI